MTYILLLTMLWLQWRLVTRCPVCHDGPQYVGRACSHCKATGRVKP